MTEIESILRGIGLIAVIAGTVLVVLQVRMHAKNRLCSRFSRDLVQARVRWAGQGSNLRPWD
jgi:hypothetical protein